MGAVVPDGGERRDREALDRRKRPDRVDIEEETTDPTDLVRFQIDNDPVLKELWDRISSTKHDVGFAKSEKMAGLEREITDIKATLRVAKWLLGFVIATTLSSVVLVATKIFSWGYGEGELSNRIHYLEKTIEGLKKYKVP